MAIKEYVVVDSDGNVLGPYVCTANNAVSSDDIRFMTKDEYIEYRSRR